MSAKSVRVEGGLDYLSATLKDSAGNRAIFIDQGSEEIRPIRGYNQGSKLENGVRLYTHSERPTQGLHVVASGAILAAMGTDDIFGLLRRLIALKAKITRLDLATDVYNSDLKLDELYDVCRRDEHKTRSRIFSMTREHDKQGIRGHGLYIGSRKRRSKLACFYRKDLESDIDEILVRCELRLYGQYSHKSAPIVANADEPLAVSAGMLRHFVDFPTVAIWNSLLKHEIVPIPARDMPESNTRRWLKDTVAKCIAREVLNDAEFATEMNEAIRLHMNDIMSDQ
jgi:hypothetical protein